MSRIISWFLKKNDFTSNPRSLAVYIESLIVDKKINEFTSYLQRKNDRLSCIDGFFKILPVMPDETYMANIFDLICKKSRLPTAEISKIISSKLSAALTTENFDIFERILQLPYPSIPILLSTPDISRLIRSCSNPDQIIKCLSILIEKNLRHDAQYLSWILIILFEYYKIGDEVIIEHFVNTKAGELVLHVPFGSHNVTPLMIFFHLYSNTKCQLIIDHYLTNIEDQSVLLQCDRWDRSYLTHLLCGECQHTTETISKIQTNDLEEINNQLMNACTHSTSILSKFAFLYKLNNKCESPVKMIFVSRFCLPLRIRLFNYLWENNLLTDIKLEEIFIHFSSNSISIYENYLLRLIHKQNLNQALVSVLCNSQNHVSQAEKTIQFLLRHGARIDDMSSISSSISFILTNDHSLIPFLLLDYSMSIAITSDMWLNRPTIRKNLYICRAIHCGYSRLSQVEFKDFKSTLSQQVLRSINNFVDLKNPTNLSNLCRRKLRCSMKHLGDETYDKLKDYLPNRLVQSIKLYEFKEWLTCYHAVINGS